MEYRKLFTYKNDSTTSHFYKAHQQPPTIVFKFEGTKSCVLFTTDLFFGPTFSHFSSSSNQTTGEYFLLEPD